MKTITCVSCGKSKEIEFRSTGDIVKNGFGFVWSMSTGLEPLILCGNCAQEIREHVVAIEDMLKLNIKYVSLTPLSNHKTD